MVQPGQLNLMTAGRGIAHSGESPGEHDPRLHGVQLWRAFERHTDLPSAQVSRDRPQGLGIPWIREESPFPDGLRAGESADRG